MFCHNPHKDIMLFLKKRIWLRVPMKSEKVHGSSKANVLVFHNILLHSL